MMFARVTPGALAGKKDVAAGLLASGAADF